MKWLFTPLGAPLSGCRISVVSSSSSCSICLRKKQANTAAAATGPRAPVSPREWGLRQDLDHGRRPILQRTNVHTHTGPFPHKGPLRFRTYKTMLAPECTA